jgi:hypothetical protein
MTDNTYNGYESYDHWNTALWLNNDEDLYSLLREVCEAALYGQISKTEALTAIYDSLPQFTPDGAIWRIETIRDLIDENYADLLQYS